MNSVSDRAYFAAGCFWGTQYYFDQVPGVVATRVGYSGGHTKNPTYEDVCYKDTGHAEVLEVSFDPQVVNYKQLVEHFLYMHNPTQVGGQGPDIGDQYRSAIFYTSDDQQRIAHDVINSKKNDYTDPIATEVTAAGEFYEAEDYHQKYAERTGRGICHRPYKNM